MKLEKLNTAGAGASSGSKFVKTCVASCQKLLAQLTAAKAAIFAESYNALGSHEHLLRLALNEAEAAAWQTRYPHLVFPVLATEKGQAVAAWSTHQRRVRRSDLSNGRVA